MRKILLSVLITCCSIVGYAYTSQEAYQMVDHMMTRLQMSTDWEDCIDEDVPGLPPQFPHAINLFESLSNSVYSSWSLSERQNAFNSFFLDLAHTNRALVSRAHSRMGELAILFCRDKCYTNVVSAIKEIIQSPMAPCKDVALLSLPWLEKPTILGNGFILASITNKTEFSKSARRQTLLLYVRSFGDTVRYDDAIATNAASLFYSNRAHIENLISVDMLLRSVYPVYSSSTNRFLLSRSALEKPTLNERERTYFVSVTNELHSAAQPLAVVPGL